MNPQDLGCEQALHRLFDFLDHELDAPEREAMQRHLVYLQKLFLARRLRAPAQAEAG